MIVGSAAVEFAWPQELLHVDRETLGIEISVSSSSFTEQLLTLPTLPGEHRERPTYG